MQPSIIIADDHPLILKGLNDFLIEKNYNVIASATNGKIALELIEIEKPEIAILDIQMPFLTGLEIAAICQEKKYNTKIIFITLEKDEGLYRKAKELNIFGYVLKEFALSEIENCITSVLNSRPYFSPELIKYLEITVAPKELDLLTHTEFEVLKYIAQNKTAKEISELMCCSDRTIEKHKSNIRNKLNLTSKATSLLLYAKENEDFL
jgi:DNA-binding NarL/FixJ family response regulator